MKKILIVTLLMPVLVFSQHKIDEYKAANGIAYHPGDTVKLGMGSAPDGSFRYLTIGGWYSATGTSSNTSANNIGRGYAHTAVIIKKIITMKWHGAQIRKFVVGGGNITNYDLQIDEAIQTCEVLPCANNKENISIADELAKLNKLYKDSVLTKDEYESQKKKLLGQ